MERIEPFKLEGNNDYFTDFDYRILSRIGTKKEIDSYIQISLKEKLLTKNTVVIAASHLTSDYVYDLFRKFPLTLKTGLIMPAFRRDKTDISELFKNKSDTKKKKYMIDFYKENILKTVLWDLEPNSMFFRDTFLYNIKHETVLRKKLKQILNEEEINELSKEIEKSELLSREKIEEFTKKYPESQELILNFRDLLYHMSGARVVNCQSSIPQENYIDYDFNNSLSDRTLLSDTDIFWKYFLEYVFTSLQNEIKLTKSTLNWLSIDDIALMRDPINDSTFISTYNDLITKSVNAAGNKDSKDILYNASEILRIRDNLQNNFIDRIDRERKSYFEKKKLNISNHIIESEISVFSDILSFIFPWHSLLTDVKGFFSNIFNMVNVRKRYKNLLEINDLRRFQVEYKAIEFKKMIENSDDIFNKTELLDFVEFLRKAIAQKIL